MANNSGLERKLSVLDSNSRPPRNTSRPTSRRGRTKFKRPPTHMERCWTEYCRSTALHGVRYFVGEHRTLFERLFWVVCMMVCLALSAYRISVVYSRWETSPPVLSVAAPTPTWEVPFPAVSICARNKTSKYGLHLCKIPDIWMSPDCVATLISVTPPLRDLVRNCTWNGIPLKVDHKTFPRVLTDDGLCYTFNMLPVTEMFSTYTAQHMGRRRNSSAPRWTLEGGYPADMPRDMTPRRAVANRMGSGLSLVMRSEGLFKVVLHSPMDLPLVNLAEDYVFTEKESASQSMRQFTFYPVPEGEAVVTVSPTLTRSSTSLLRLAPHRRRCYFPSERRLVYFQVYTQRNCELECAVNHTAKVCGCSPMYMPRLWDQSTCRWWRHCTDEKTEDDDSGHSGQSGHPGYSGHAGIDCDCLPTCTSIGYHSRVAHYSWLRESARATAAGEPGNAELKKWAGLSRISVQVKGTTMTAIGRTESYSRPEFLADCGGLLGLFSGFSIITLVEVLFHLIIKWTCYVFKWNQ